MTGADVDPFWLLGQDDSAWGQVDCTDPLGLAVQRFDPSRPGPLDALLAADDPLIRRRGLFVFGELGRKALGLLDQALRSIDHPDEMTRAALMDGVICYPGNLSPEQARIVLSLADDPSDFVRSKVVAFLRESDIDVLRVAISGMAPDAALRQSRELKRLAEPDCGAQALLEAGASSTGLPSTFALATVERMAKNGLIEDAPEGVDGSWIVEVTLAQIARLMKRSVRRHEAPD